MRLRRNHPDNLCVSIAWQCMLLSKNMYSTLSKCHGSQVAPKDRGRPFKPETKKKFRNHFAEGHCANMFVRTRMRKYIYPDICPE